jgi:hypothetical protein
MVKFSKKIGSYIFEAPSRRAGKKYDVYRLNGQYITSFGARNYEQYKDKIGYYSSYDHKSKLRRERYYYRHGKIATKESAKWFSHRFLW